MLKKLGNRKEEDKEFGHNARKIKGAAIDFAKGRISLKTKKQRAESRRKLGKKIQSSSVGFFDSVRKGFN